MTSTHGPQTIEQDRVLALSDRVTGDVLTPDDPRYDEPRHTLAPHLEQRPAGGAGLLSRSQGHWAARCPG